MGIRVDEDELRRWVDEGLVPAKALGLPERQPLLDIDEKEFQTQVVSLAKRNGWKVYHTYSSKRSEPGFPDLVFRRAGRIIVAELKVGDNTPTEEQEEWLADFRAAGIPTFVWTPASWPEIVEVLK